MSRFIMRIGRQPPPPPKPAHPHWSWYASRGLAIACITVCIISIWRHNT